MTEQFPEFSEFHGDGSPSVSKVGPEMAFRRFFSNYARFSGRATRSEYWWIALFFFVVVLVVQLVARVASGPSPSFYHVSGANLSLMIAVLVLVVVSVVPLISLSVRRLHDSNNPGWLFLLNLIPFIGQIVLIIFLALPSNARGARFDRQEK